MLTFIENVSKRAVADGTHFDPGKESVLIQIIDPGREFPVPLHKFKEVYQFEFLDADAEDIARGVCEEDLIQPAQAAELVRILEAALDKNMHVVVHCTAGICRSGAVVEVATLLGFTSTGNWRQPNVRVKTYMMQAAGFTSGHQLYEF